MKRLSTTCFLIAFILTACGSTTTPLASPSQAITETPTIFAPTDVPPIPTETVDPNMPPDATGKDSQGNYIQTAKENSIDKTYT